VCGDCGQRPGRSGTLLVTPPPRRAADHDAEAIQERLRLGLQGLLPYAVATPAQLVDRAMKGLRALPRDLDRYMALSSVQERNEQLFYRDGDRPSRGNPALDLHADCRRSLPALFAHRARAQGVLHHGGRQRAHRENRLAAARTLALLVKPRDLYTP
jgi:hypothetical protein